MNQLLKRTISGALFAALMLSGILINEYTFLGLMSAVLVCANVEFYRLTIPGRHLLGKICLMAAQLSFLVAAFCCIRFHLDTMWLLAALVPVPLAMISMLRTSGEEYDFAPALFFPLLYIAFPLVCSLFLAFPYGNGYSRVILISLLAMIWMNDIGAYLTGMAFGQREGSRKLCPKLSPKKSWAGVIGGTLFTFLTALCLVIYVRPFSFGGHFPLWGWWALALVVCLLGVPGDLFESLIKRRAGVKDSGNLIPGHGGVLDRFDDVLFIFPAAAAFVQIIQKLL